MYKVSVIFGTRPEVIKLAPLINAFKKNPEIQLSVCFTGQHKEMVLPLVDFFGLEIDSYLDIMQPNQTLAALSSRSLAAIDNYLDQLQPDIVFVQGDTTSAMCAALAAFYRKIKVAHIEAGLRTWNLQSPFPEELNRQIVGKITDLHFTPTEAARQNLLKEGVDKSRIFVTGNTVIDALQFTLEKVKFNKQYTLHLPFVKNDRRIVLITGHRRENFGEGFENICAAIRALAERFKNCDFIYPVHLNPNVQAPVKRILNGVPNIHLLPPIDYIHFTQLMEKSYLIITDSGGIQEEAPGLGKPVLIMRDTTERPEAIQAGSAKLVGTTIDAIVENASLLLENEEAYRKMSTVANPFGDGKAAKKIVDHTINYFVSYAVVGS